MITNEEMKRLVMTLSFKERKKKQLEHYRQDLKYFQNMEKDELDLEYINAKTEYENKKNIISIFLIFILLSVLLELWKFFYGFIENLFSYYAVPKPNEFEIVQVSLAIFAILIVSISCIALGILISYIRRMRQIYRSLIMIEELRKRDFNLNKLMFGKLGFGKAYHPWDGLKKCKCGGSPWMVGKDGEDYHSGAPYYIKCTDCGNSTFKSNDKEAIKIAWNKEEY